MRLNLIVLALALFSQSAFAFDCKTVMGGCPTQEAAVTSTHMRTDVIGKKAEIAPTKAVTAGSTSLSAKKSPAKK